MMKTHLLLARFFLAVVLLAISCRLAWLWEEGYGLSEPLYVLLNGAIILLAVPEMMRSLLGLFRDARMSANLLVLVIALAAMGTGRWLEAATVACLSILAETLMSLVFKQSQKMVSMS
ncbi:MAG: hypothetical protein V2A34_13275, partial [Lentisphaerota bacterium]